MESEHVRNIKAMREKVRNIQAFSYPGAETNPLPSSNYPLNGVNVQPKQRCPQAPPPVPPRPHTSSHLSNRYGGIPLGYGSPLSLGLGGRTMPYTSYGALGGLGYGSRYGYAGGYGVPDIANSDNIFIRMAEESSRPAFQSIESMVNTVGSISMMLESTYYAVHSSYRAVLGVVDQFSRLRSHLAHMLSTLALLRALQWLCLKVLRVLGLRHSSPSAEAAWSAATSAVTPSDGTPAISEPHATWPIFMFMGVVFGAPWLIYRIFSKMAYKKAEEIWNPQDQDKGRIIAMYDFTAAQPGEVSMKRGQMYLSAPKKLQPKIPGWTLICTGPQTTGLVPTSYIRRIMVKPSAASTAPSSTDGAGGFSENVPLPVVKELFGIQEENILPPPTFAEGTNAPVLEVDEFIESEIRTQDCGNTL